MVAPSRRRAAKGLPDLSSLEVDLKVPAADRIAAIMEATGGDPYRFRSGKVEVELAFAGEASIEEILAHHAALYGPLA